MGATFLDWRKLPKGPVWLSSPHLKPWQKKILADIQKRAPVDKNLIWILSSGTQALDSVKCIALTREAILASARAVNRHLQITESDRWLLALPTYHVGGLSILARAFLGGNKIFHLSKWNPQDFVGLIEKNKVTVCSLVPTQVFDLVQGQLHAPKSLRAIAVGGGPLEPSLYREARDLNWPLLPCYGLTESSSQMSAAPLSSLSENVFPGLQPIWPAEVELRDQRIFVRSPSCCTFVAQGKVNGEFTLESPLRNGWLPTEDLGEIVRGGFKVIGRRDQLVKVMGALVSLSDVERRVHDFLRSVSLSSNGQNVSGVVLALSGGREGNRLLWITDTDVSLQKIDDTVSKYNHQALGLERLHSWAWLPELPRTELKKVRLSFLKSLFS